MVLAPNTSVRLRTLSERDVTTAITIKCVSLFDVDYSIQCALSYGLLEPRRRVRDRERKIGYTLHKGTETLVRDRERFEIEGVRDKESQL